MKFAEIVKNIWQKIWQCLMDAVFPKKCVTCAKDGSYLCDPCRARIPALHFEVREGIRIAAPYAHPAVRKLIWLLKYRGIKEIALILADWIYETIIEELSEISIFREQQGKIFLVPIPLSNKRQRKRGFNQAEEIVKRLSEIDPKIFRAEIGNLIKIKDTPTQVSQEKRSRRTNNLRGAFKVSNRKRLKGRTIILVDDVTTTGATLNEATRVLEQARPRRIIRIAGAG